MIIQLEKNITPRQKQDIYDFIGNHGYTCKEVTTQLAHYLIGVGKKEFDIRLVGKLPGVKDIHRVSDNYKLVSRKWKVKDTAITLSNGESISRDALTIMAGPCAIEGEEQIKDTVGHLKQNKIKIMRGGVYKPRSSPYSYRGMGIEGLKMFSSICHENNIAIITEVMQVSQIEEMVDHVDIFQVGARNSQNFNLLDALGQLNKPVLLKRGMSGSIDELLYSAEYIFSGGNEQIILCERGIRTHENAYRNTLDLNAVPILKEKSHLPVVVDPSHGIGIRRFVEPVALAAVMAGADGIIAEVHQSPEKALSDGQQTLSHAEAELFYQRLRKTYDLKKGIY
jgi:3-deoxy-7-phosphoheptulonate synthase